MRNFPKSLSLLVTGLLVVAGLAPAATANGVTVLTESSTTPLAAGATPALELQFATTPQFVVDGSQIGTAEGDFKLSKIYVGLGVNYNDSTSYWDWTRAVEAQELSCNTVVACSSLITVTAVRSGQVVTFPVASIGLVDTGILVVEFEDSSTIGSDPGFLPGDSPKITFPAGSFEIPVGAAVTTPFLQYNFLIVGSGVNGFPELPHVVKLHENAGTNEYIEVNLADGDPAPALPNSFAKPGYTFVEWHTSPTRSHATTQLGFQVGETFTWESGEVDFFDPNLSIEPITDIYAVWKPNSELYFNKAKNNFYSNGILGLGPIRYQYISGRDNGLGLGGSFEPNEEIHYYGVTTVDGQSVDARVKVTRVEAVLDGSIDDLDDDASFGSYEENEWINTGVDFDRSATEADAYFEIEIQFLSNLLQNPETTSSVEIAPFSLTVYDLDEEQYIETTRPISVAMLPNNSHLSTLTNSESGLFRVQSSSDSTETNDQLLTAYNKGRVTLNFAGTSVLKIRLGLKTLAGEAGPETAVYSLDFGPGISWGETQPQTLDVAPDQPELNPVSSVPYEGPVNLRHVSNSLCSTDVATVTGQRLDTIQSVSIDGVPTTFKLTANGELTYGTNGLAAGSHTVSFWVPISGLYLTEKITVGDCVGTSTVSSQSGNFKASKLFSNYRGDRGAIALKDKQAIAKFIKQYKGITSVTCIGSTSGVPAKRTDAALARSRAKNACDYVKTLLPNAKISLQGTTGKGVGQKFRSVTIQVAGTN